MYRCLAAFLVLVSVPFIQPEASAKGAPPTSVKKAPAVKSVSKEVKKGTASSAKAEPQTEAVVRTHAAVMPVETDVDIDLSQELALPEGALYTTSDECA